MGKRINVLVVEDEVIIARTVKRGLEFYGYNVPETFTCGKDTFKYVEEQDFQYDIALVDIKLKGSENGIVVAETLKTKYNIPSIFTTAYAEKDLINRAKSLNPYGYVVKPFSAIDLHTTLQIALQQLSQEKLILEKRHWLASSLNSFRLPVITTEITGKIKYTNYHCRNSFGAKISQATQKSLFEVLSFDSTSLAEIKDFYEQIRKGNKAVSLFMSDVKVQQGKDWQEFYLNILPISSKKVALGALWIFKDKNESSATLKEEKKLIRFSSKIIEVSDELKSAVKVQDRAGLQLKAGDVFDGIVGQSDKMLRIFDTIKQIANTNSNVLILGETGTGKEVIARAIHKMSLRKDNKFVPVDCVAIPDTLMESELFGFEKGAFTGANALKFGLFELADKGTIFLDEISEMGINIQAKLLRVLQQREFRRIGGQDVLPLDIRIISAMNKSPKRQIKNGSFRQDLFYRLNVIPIVIPPLRKRKSDIPLLIKFFVEKFVEAGQTGPKRFSDESLNLMKNYKWPGNVRQLQNVVERIAVLSNDELIEPSMLPEYLKVTQSEIDNTSDKILNYQAAKKKRMETFECEYFKDLLEKSNSNVSLAASLAGISEKTLYRAIKKYKELLK